MGPAKRRKIPELSELSRSSNEVIIGVRGARAGWNMGYSEAEPQLWSHLTLPPEESPSRHLAIAGLSVTVPDANVIVDGDTQFLLAARVPLGCLHAHVPEQELDLLQLAAGDMMEMCARSPKIMRSHTAEVGLRKLPNYAPDHLLGNAVAPNRACLIDASEQRPSVTCAAVVQQSNAPLTHSGIRL